MFAMWEMILAVFGGVSIVGGGIFMLLKFAEPIKKFFSQVKKTEYIEKNQDGIKKLGSENQSQNEQIQALQKDVTGIDKRLGRVENTLKDIKDGVECLLGASLGLINDPERSKEIYRDLQNC